MNGVFNTLKIKKVKYFEYEPIKAAKRQKKSPS